MFLFLFKGRFTSCLLFVRGPLNAPPLGAGRPELLLSLANAPGDRLAHPGWAASLGTCCPAGAVGELPSSCSPFSSEGFRLGEVREASWSSGTGPGGCQTFLANRGDKPVFEPLCNPGR